MDNTRPIYVALHLRCITFCVALHLCCIAYWVFNVKVSGEQQYCECLAPDDLWEVDLKDELYFGIKMGHTY